MRIRSLLLAALCAAPAAAAEPAETLSVAVAANMMPTMTEIRAGFFKKTGVELALTPGSSGRLVAQIESGAPFDLLVSADMDYPRALAEKKLTDGPVRYYASGRLILWTLSGADVSKGLASLRDPAVKKIALADPQTAPYGRAAVEALKAAGVYDEVKDKLVFGESVSQVNQFVASKAADVGLTARSVVAAPAKGAWADVDAKLHAPIEQGLAVTTRGAKEHGRAARLLADFIIGREGREVLRRGGYEVPKP